VTTIAWDGRTLAADSLIQGNRFYNVQKIWKFDNGLIFAGSGERQNCMIVKAYLEELDRERFINKTDFSRLPTKPTIPNDFSGIIVVNKKAYRIENLIQPWELPSQFACGSGCDFATAAMALGKTAPEAVLFASRFDLYTGNDVTFFDV